MMRAIGFMTAVALLAQTGLAVAQSVLPEGMTVHLQTKDEISSKTAKKGDPVSFVVRDPVVIGGVTMIPAGSTAVGQVARVRDNGLLGRSGKLEISVSHIDSGGRQIPVRGANDKKGKAGTVGVVGAAVVFLPLGLLVRGREATIKAGTPVDVYVAQEVPMTVASAEPVAAPESTPEPASVLRAVDLPPSAVAEPVAPPAPSVAGPLPPQ